MIPATVRVAVVEFVYIAPAGVPLTTLPQVVPL